jgi:hypothetical protein
VVHEESMPRAGTRKNPEMLLLCDDLSVDRVFLILSGVSN